MSTINYKQTGISIVCILGLQSISGLVFADTVINEVLGSTTGSDTEYIELFNRGESADDISGWTIELWDSDASSSFGLADAGSPYTVPAGTMLQPGEHYLFANSLAQNAFMVMPDVVIQDNAIENSSYTIVLRDNTDQVRNTIFVVDSGLEDAPNIAGVLITPDLAIGPDGSNLPAGFTRLPDGADELALLEFAPVPAASGTPTPQSGGGDPPGGDPERISIMAIQGTAHTSAVLGIEVLTGGVVTAVDTNGFYLQDPIGDGDIATSDALFVFTGSNPGVSVGDLLDVTGTVSEFTPGGASSRNLSTTQVSSSTISNVGTAALPAPVVLGAAGRIVPNQNIDDDAFTSFDPDTDGIDFFESLEAMRVLVPAPLAVAGTNRFGEIFTVADSAASASGISARQTLNISPDDFNPEKIQIDTDSGVLPGFDLPQVDTGTSLSDITGVVGYGFGNFEVIPTSPFTAGESVISAESTTIQFDQDHLTVASYNVLNLDPNDNDGDSDIADGRFIAIAEHIVNRLQAPDIIALQEIQDNDGSDSSDTTAADLTLQTLSDAIVSAGGPAYLFADTPGLVPNSVGGQPGGNIRVAFLYNSSRVTLTGPATPLTDPADQAVNILNPFYASRISLAANFQFGNRDVTIVNNHLSSKGGSAPILGVEQPFNSRQEEFLVNGSLDERQLQAQAVSDYVSAALAEDSEARIIVLGDMNEFEFISPVRDILGANLVNTTNSVADNERYSFIFQGNSQQLDHILLSDSIASTALFDIVHVNAEFAETSQRASDHDPLLVSIRLGGDNEPAGDADLNNDGEIDIADYLIFQRSYLRREGQNRYNPDADYDNNQRVNRQDLLIFLELYRSELALLTRGDIDRDGDIDQADVRLLRRAWRRSAGQRRYNPDADLDNNNRVNRADLNLLLDLQNESS